ncbi:hypothetical protein AVEN_101528-1 [Araneus ventricosus]|uniref:Uncharacterized protein n=1 Tax=Araneus ventricosus TaxID=182803 RepID=A0A4Y2GTW0_ARAVE|nr:hypothetical protein AVEN_101528-1 [Araneus ventricosus]
MGCNMSLKIHFLHSHLEFYPESLASVSDEHGERFHQDISNMGARDRGKWNPKMLVDYIWKLKMDIPQAKHSRQAKTLKSQDGRSAEFSIIFRIGLISGSSSCAFWISLKDHQASVVMVKASIGISLSILNFFSAFEQCSQPSIQRT